MLFIYTTFCDKNTCPIRCKYLDLQTNSPYALEQALKSKG